MRIPFMYAACRDKNLQGISYHGGCLYADPERKGSPSWDLLVTPCKPLLAFCKESLDPKTNLVQIFHRKDTKINVKNVCCFLDAFPFVINKEHQLEFWCLKFCFSDINPPNSSASLSHWWKGIKYWPAINVHICIIIHNLLGLTVDKAVQET